MEVRFGPKLRSTGTILGILILAAGLLVSSTQAAQVQSENPELILRLNREWGYGGINNQIQGLFNMQVSGLEELVKVEFWIDGKRMATVEEEPFEHHFNTDSYEPRAHQLMAIGYTAGWRCSPMWSGEDF